MAKVELRLETADVSLYDVMKLHYDRYTRYREEGDTGREAWAKADADLRTTVEESRLNRIMRSQMAEDPDYWSEVCE